MKKTFPILLGLSFALIMFSCKTQTKEIIKQNDKTIKTVVHKKTLLIEKSLSQVVPETPHGAENGILHSVSKQGASITKSAYQPAE